MIQLNPPIPLKTPKGDGMAHFVTNYGIEFNLIWTVFLDETGEIWEFQNPQVRAQKNITMGRCQVENPRDSAKKSRLQEVQNAVSDGAGLFGIDRL